MTLQIFTVKNLVVKMNDKELECFKHFLEAYKNQWDLNRYARDQYDEDLEYYCSYRPAERYPLLYNESFNKLLPRIFTVMARFMDQLYQAGTGNLISVKPRKKSDVDRAPRIEGLLNYQLETLNDIDMQGGSYLFNFQWMFNALSWGKGIAKVYWRKEERIAPRRIDVPIPVFDDYGRLEGIENKTIIVKDMQTVYDGPYAEVLHNKLFVPHPFYKNIQKMPFCFCVYKKSINDLKVMQEAGIYKNIKNLGWGSPKSGDASLDSYEAFAKSIEIMGVSAEDCFSSSRSAPMVDVIEGYGKYIFPEDDTAYEVGSGVKIKGKESEAIVHIGNYKTLLSIQKNEYGIRPFFDIGCYYHPELYWDTGIISLGKGIQEQYNTLANTRFQNAIMLVNQMLKVNVDADIPPEALQWKPHGIIPVESMDDVQPLVQPDASQSYAFREQENFFDETLQEMTGVYAYNMGATPDRQERVGTIHSLQAMGDARSKLLLMTMDHTGFRPFLKYMMTLNTFHMTADFEAKISSNMGDEYTKLLSGDFHVDYDFSARYTGMEPALGKMYRAEKLLQLAAMWKDSPYLQHFQWNKAIMELMDFQNTDKYLKTPEQLKQEQQQAMQQQMMGLMMQDQLEANKQRRQLESDTIKALAK